MDYWYTAGLLLLLARQSISAHTFPDFSSDSSSCFCSGCNCCTNYNWDSFSSSLAGYVRGDLVGEVASATETLNSCTTAAASLVVAILIGFEHGGEHRRHPLFLPGRRILLFGAVVIDIYCSGDHHVEAKQPEKIEVVDGLIWQGEVNARTRDEGEQC